MKKKRMKERGLLFSLSDCGCSVASTGDDSSRVFFWDSKKKAYSRLFVSDRDILDFEFFDHKLFFLHLWSQEGGYCGSRIHVLDGKKNHATTGKLTVPGMKDHYKFKKLAESYSEGSGFFIWSSYRNKKGFQACSMKGYNGKLYCGCLDGKIFELDPDTHRKKLIKERARSVECFVVHQGVLYDSCGKKITSTLEEDKKPLISNASKITSTFSLEEKLYFGDEKGCIKEFSDGKVRVVAKRGGASWREPVTIWGIDYFNGELIDCGSYSGMEMILKTESGERLIPSIKKRPNRGGGNDSTHYVGALFVVNDEVYSILKENFEFLGKGVGV